MPAATVPPVTALQADALAPEELGISNPYAATIRELASPVTARVAAVADYDPPPDIALDTPRGGIAARTNSVTGDVFPGDVFTLFSSDTFENTYVWSSGTYTPGGSRAHPETIAANLVANQIASDASGTDLAVVNFVSPTAGGASVGLAAALTYLNIATNGAFSGSTSIAATGKIARNGAVQGVSYVTSKSVAAAAADVDVMFTASRIDDHMAVVQVGYPDMPSSADRPRRSERHWDDYQAWGAMYANLDAVVVVQVRHLGDVAAYLCGAGSASACDYVNIFETLDVPLDMDRTLRPVTAVLEAMCAAGDTDACDTR